MTGMPMGKFDDLVLAIERMRGALSLLQGELAHLRHTIVILDRRSE